MLDAPKNPTVEIRFSCPTTRGSKNTLMAEAKAPLSVQTECQVEGHPMRAPMDGEESLLYCGVRYFKGLARYRFCHLSLGVISKLHGSGVKKAVSRERSRAHFRG